MEAMKVDIEKFKLDSGSHKSILDGVCAMELVSYMAGEPFSDRPKCACPALTSYVMRLNDKLDDKNRQRLKAFLPRLLNTRDDKTQQRAKILAHAALTVFAPAALDSANLPEWAAKMRALPFGEWQANAAVAREARSAAAAYAAYAADADAAAYAAYAAYAADAAAYAAYAAADAAADAACRSAAKTKLWDQALEVLEQALSV